MRTVFNILGPLTNPAGVKRQVIGVFSADLCQPLAEVLKMLGAEHAMVVHSDDGLDEISIAAGTAVTELRDGNIDEKARLRRAWEQNRTWARESLEIFGIDVRLKIDPLFAEIARDMQLGDGRHKVLFLPTHQSVFDHPVLNYVLNDPQFMQAMGWSSRTRAHVSGQP